MTMTTSKYRVTFQYVGYNVLLLSGLPMTKPKVVTTYARSPDSARDSARARLPSSRYYSRLISVTEI